MQGPFSDATLLLVAHGSSINPDSALAAHQHAAALRDRQMFARVDVAFWRQEPFIRDIARSAESSRIFVAPLFLSDGYFTQQAIPRALGLRGEHDESFAPVQKLGRTVWYYCAPFGTHPRMTEVVLSRADEVVACSGIIPDPTETCLCLAAHGTTKNDQSRAAADWQANEIRSLGKYSEVCALFMEEEPRISDYARFVSAQNLVVVPFFIGDGLHSREDVPVLLGEKPEIVQQRMRSGEPTWVNPTERNEKRIWYSRSIGTAPLVPDLILERVFERAGGRAANHPTEN